MDYKSEIVLGGKYRDMNTGIEGQAVLIEFHLHQCERVVLEYVKDGDLKMLVFDAARLEVIGQAPESYNPPSTGGLTGSRSASRL